MFELQCYRKVQTSGREKNTMISDAKKGYFGLFLLFLALGLLSACSTGEEVKEKVQIIYSGNMWGYLEPCPT